MLLLQFFNSILQQKGLYLHSHLAFIVVHLLSFNHLHLVADPAATIRAAHDMLRPGGLFISKTVCMQSSLKLRMMKPLIGLMKAFGKAPGTVRFFTTEAYDAMIRDAGFDLVETGFYAFPRRFVVARKL